MTKDCFSGTGFAAGFWHIAKKSTNIVTWLDQLVAVCKSELLFELYVVYSYYITGVVTPSGISGAGFSVVEEGVVLVVLSLAGEVVSACSKK